MERLYGTATTFHSPILKVDGTFATAADWTPVAGDVLVWKDGVAAAIGTLPVAIAGGGVQGGTTWLFTLADVEAQAAEIVVTLGDATTKVVQDDAWYIETYGDSNAMHGFNRAMAGVRLAESGLDDLLNRPLLSYTDPDTIGSAIHLLYSVLPLSGIMSVVSDIPTAAIITGAVWDAARAGHAVTGSFGEGVASVRGNVTGAVAATSTVTNPVTLAANAVNASALASDAILELLTAFQATSQFAFVGRATAGGSLTVTLGNDLRTGSAASSASNFYKGMVLRVTAGTGINQIGVVASYDGTTHILTMYDAMAIHLDASSTLIIIAN